MRGLILRDCAQEGPERRRIEGYIPVGVLKSTASPYQPLKEPTSIICQPLKRPDG